jgi:hypothetical protein
MGFARSHARSIGLSVLAVVLLHGSHSAQGTCTGTPGEESWSPYYDWSGQMIFIDDCSGTPMNCAELEISHAALIPKGMLRGMVLLWRKERENTPCTGCQDADTDKTWVFNPMSPEKLGTIPQALSSDIFCGGLSWDRYGQLVVTGGVPTPECSLMPFPCTTCAFPETYRFQPQEVEIVGLTPGGQMIVTGSPWKKVGNMALGRYYPTNIALNKTQLYRSLDFDLTGGGMESAPLPLSMTLVAGGPVCGGGDGNELWELLEPKVTGVTSWSLPFLPQNPDSQDLPNYPSQNNSPHYQMGQQYDPYTRPPSGLLTPDQKNTPNPLLDSYPRMFQTSESAQILVCGDVETSPMVTPNFPGCVWVIKPRLSTTGPQDYWQDLNGPVGVDPDGPPTPPAMPTTGLDNWHDSFYDTAVLLHQATSTPPMLDRVLMFGGSRNDGTNGWVVNRKVWEFEKGASGNRILTGVWREKQESTLFQRLYLNSVVLPTGEIFIEGGTSTEDTSSAHCSGCNTTPVYKPIIYNPGVDASDPGTPFEQEAPPDPMVPGFTITEATARLYHHVAVLLPNGSVFVAGGKRARMGATSLTPSNGYPDPRFSGEIFSPPYLDDAVRTRPRFETPPPNEVLFGATLQVQIRHTSGLEIDRIVLLRPAAVTHHWDADQRYIELAFAVNSSLTETEGTEIVETFDVQAPDITLGPAGFYMLFAVEDDAIGPAQCTIEGHRIPTVGHFINVQ